MADVCAFRNRAWDRENVSRLFGFSMQGLVDSKMKAFKKFHQELRYDRVE